MNFYTKTSIQCLIFTVLSININALGAAPQIILDSNTLSLRTQPDDEITRSPTSSHKLQFSFGTQIPLNSAFEISSGLEESQAQIQSVFMEYSWEFNSHFDFRSGLGIENQQVKSQVVSGSNRTLFRAGITTFPAFTLSGVFHFYRTQNFKWSLGNSLGLGYQKLSFDSTDTSSVEQSLNQFRFSNNLFLEAQFLRNDDNHYYLRAGWAFRQLPNGTLNDTIDTLVVSQNVQGFSIAAGFGYLF